jgi:hypothetical protein
LVGQNPDRLGAEITHENRRIAGDRRARRTQADQGHGAKNRETA